MLNFVDFLTNKISNMIWQGAAGRMSDKEFLEREISAWKASPQRIMQIKGHLYYENDHDILRHKRMVIGKNGDLEEVRNLPNNRIIDNQYGKMVSQKANYLLGQPISFECDNKKYLELIKQIFNKRFMRTIKSGGKAALNGGIAWLYPYYNEQGELSFRVFPGYEILPFWQDSEHTVLDFAVRLYTIMSYEGTIEKVVEKVEVYDLKGVHRFILDGGSLIPDVSIEQKDFETAYVTTTDAEGTLIGLNWQKIPLIPLKYNDSEIPLIKKVKTLQDGINMMLSTFENNMQEDPRNKILVLKNYDGENLGEFRKNLATYGAVKVLYDGETKGGVETLDITVNSENYKAILEIFKKALIENAMGFDAKDDRLSGNPNQMNIQSMYSDIDLDANDMETEFQAAFEEILWFVNAYLADTGRGDFEEEVTVIFNRDMLMDEGQIIENIRNSEGILSDETLIGQHPFIDDPKTEMERLQKQRQKEQEEFDDHSYNPWKLGRAGDKKNKEGETSESEET